MLAVWACRMENQVPTGFYWDLPFNSGILATIARKLLRAFSRRTIHKPRTLQQITSYNPHQKQKHLKYLPGWNNIKLFNASIVILNEVTLPHRISIRKRYFVRLPVMFNSVWVIFSPRRAKK